MNPNEPNTQNEQAVQTEAERVRSTGHSRRAFLFKLSLLANGAVGAVLAVPIIGYLLGPSIKKDSSGNSWITLGPLSDFPEGETRVGSHNRNSFCARATGVPTMLTGRVPPVRRSAGCLSMNTGWPEGR